MTFKEELNKYLGKLNNYLAILTFGSMILLYGIKNEINKEQAQIFGTVKNPKYLISAKFSENVYDSIKCESESKKVTCSINNTEAVKFSKDGINCSEISILLDEDQNTDYNKINEVELSKKLFESLTGKKFPIQAEVLEEKLCNNADCIKRIGYYMYSPNVHLTKRLIVYKNIDKISNLASLLHEDGHMIVQYSEGTFIFGNKKEKSVLEEACAYAFESAGLDELFNYDGELMKKISLTAKINFKKQIMIQSKEFYHGKDDDEKHNEASALLLATSEVLKNPYDTFNYLATLGSLDNLHPKIKAQMEKDRKSFGNNN